MCETTDPLGQQASSSSSSSSSSLLAPTVSTWPPDCQEQLHTLWREMPEEKFEHQPSAVSHFKSTVNIGNCQRCLDLMSTRTVSVLSPCVSWSLALGKTAARAQTRTFKKHISTVIQCRF
ncbi:hypothetical protein GN956_G24087 [Arapaima gigas]